MRENDGKAFIRLATQRTNKAIKQIRLIGNLSNKSNYVYDDKQVVAIFSAIASEIEDAKIRFSKSKPKPFSHIVCQLY